MDDTLDLLEVLIATKLPAQTIKTAVPHQRVIFTVHEMKRLGRGTAELLAIAEDLGHHDIVMADGEAAVAQG
ncbi:hypothetical protein ACWEQG_21050 [Microbispora sp. NPDC004025]